MRNSLTISVAFALLSCSCSATDPIDYVDPMIGTGYHGHTYPGAVAPFGMVQLSPDTRAGDWDACSGYHYSDSTINGFSHTHLSGTGCADLADVMFYPSLREDLVVDGGFVHRPYIFSHDRESASCGYYRVELPSENIVVELTASPRVGVHRYSFSGGGRRSVVIDLKHTVADEIINFSSLSKVAPNRVDGGRSTTGWVVDQKVYFSAQFSQPIETFELLDERCALVTFPNNITELTVAVGLSSVSCENANLNLVTEVPEVDFDIVRQKTVDLWREALSDIVVEGASHDQLVNFYTAQYHSKLSPTLASDVNGQYRRHDQSIGTMAEGRNYYSTFSLWDTFRAWHPLQTLVKGELVDHMVASMIDMYECTGELPIWPLASGETGTMIGYHAVSVIADAYLRGIRGFDAQKALDAMIQSSNINKKGSDYYLSLGYIPSNIKRESVSCLLEYAYDDWCIARMARQMGREELAKEYEIRACNYINVFDGSTGFFRGRREDGNWTSPFNEFVHGRDYTEATAWQYRFFVPHDVNGMVQLFGSREAFITQLDRLFTLETEHEVDLQDITGILGQYAHGNEPSHHMAYLYNYVGEPWKTQQMTRRLLDQMYAPTPEGIIGNEDCGQMSAWYIFTSLGLYPVCPASGQFSLTTPQFERGIIRLTNGKELIITANNPAKNHYINSVTLNGVAIDTNFVTYDQLLEGGELRFELCRQPNLERGVDPSAWPYSLTEGGVVSIPFTTQDVSLFLDSVSVDLATTTTGAQIRYTLDGSEPNALSPLYSAPIVVRQTLTLRAKGFGEGMEPSRTLTLLVEKAKFIKPLNISVSPPGVRYSYYEGKFSRVDQIRSGKFKTRGVMPSPSIEAAPKEDHYGYIFEGLISIPESGVWEFTTKSDDGSVLYIADQKVVDNDSSHASIAATGRVALEKGMHPYKLLYFEDYEGQDLWWGWRSPSSSEVEPIPATNLFVN